MIKWYHVIMEYQIFSGGWFEDSSFFFLLFFSALRGISKYLIFSSSDIRPQFFDSHFSFYLSPIST